eukprot:691938-Pelagomonas_calceolata.AAC.4
MKWTKAPEARAILEARATERMNGASEVQPMLQCSSLANPIHRSRRINLGDRQTSCLPAFALRFHATWSGSIEQLLRLTCLGCWWAPVQGQVYVPPNFCATCSGGYWAQTPARVFPQFKAIQLLRPPSHLRKGAPQLSVSCFCLLHFVVGILYLIPQFLWARQAGCSTA